MFVILFFYGKTAEPIWMNFGIKIKYTLKKAMDYFLLQ